MNRRFVSKFANNVDKASNTGDFLPKVKYYNVMIDGQNVFNQPLKIDRRTYDNIEKIEVAKGDDYKTNF